MAEEEIKARIGIDTSQYIAGIQQVIQNTNNMRDSIKQARETMEHVAKVKYEAKIRADNKEAIKKANEVKENIKKLHENKAIIIAAQDMAKDKIKNIKNTLGNLTGRPHRVVLRAIDNTKKVIARIRDSIFNLKTLAAGIVFGAGGKLIFDNTIGNSARLEQEEVAMKHFINYQNRNKKGFNVNKSTADFIKELRHNANVTPFGTNKVISAGRRAVNIMQGDTKKSMGLVTLAEDMAAANPGKTIMDSMEALADLKTGEFERMKEFGFKFSAEQFKGLVGKGKKDDLTESEMNKAYDILVKDKLNPVFGGASQEVSKTMLGKWSTTTGMIQNIGSNLGKPFLTPINKVLTDINGQMEKIEKSKAFKDIQKQVGNFANIQGKKANKIINDFINNPKKVSEKFNDAKKGIKEFVDVIKSIGKVAKEAYNFAKPLIKFAGKHPKAALGLFAGLKLGPGLFKGILKAPKNIKQLKKDFSDLKTALGFLKGGSKNKFKAFTGIFKGIGKGAAKNTLKGIKGTLKFIKTIGRGLGTVFKYIGRGASVAFKTTLKVIKIAGKAIGKGLMSMFKVFKIVGSGIIKIAGRVFVFLAANPIVAIIMVIIGIVILLHQAWKHNWGGIREKTKVAIDFCKQKIASIKETFNAVKEKCIEFKDKIIEIWNNIKKFVKHPIKGTVNLIQKSIDKVKGKKTGENALGTSYWGGGLTWVGENGPELIELERGAKVHSNRSSLEKMQSPKISVASIVSPIVNSSNMLKQMKSLKNKSSIWGKDVTKEFGSGIKNNLKSVNEVVTLMANGIRELIHFSSPDKGPLSDFHTYSPDMMKTFGMGVKNNIRFVTNPVVATCNNIRNILKSLILQCNSYGQQIIRQLGQGMQSSGNNLTSIAKTLTDKVIKTFEEGFDIHSPSRIMYRIGKYVMQGFVNGLDSKDLKTFAKKHIETITGVFGSAVNVPGGVSRWLTSALMATRTSLSWLPGLQRLVMAESGGNPNSWNSISVGGEHATGLLQTLPSTFREFMQTGMNNILNPIHNAAAAINYIKSRYGSVYNTPLFKGGSYVGYATGTKNATPGYHWVGENGPELMKFKGGEKVIDNKSSMKLGNSIFIDKLANTLIVREEADINKIATKLAYKLKTTKYNMA